MLKIGITRSFTGCSPQNEHLRKLAPQRSARISALSQTPHLENSQKTACATEILGHSSYHSLPGGTQSKPSAIRNTITPSLEPSPPQSRPPYRLAKREMDQHHAQIEPRKQQAIELQTNPNVAKRTHIENYSSRIIPSLRPLYSKSHIISPLAFPNQDLKTAKITRSVHTEARHVTNPPQQEHNLTFKSPRGAPTWRLRTTSRRRCSRPGSRAAAAAEEKKAKTRRQNPPMGEYINLRMRPSTRASPHGGGLNRWSPGKPQQSRTNAGSTRGGGSPSPWEGGRRRRPPEPVLRWARGSYATEPAVSPGARESSDSVLVHSSTSRPWAYRLSLLGFQGP